MADILIIDDDEMMIDIIADALGDAGHATRSAPDGPAGIAEALRQCPDAIVLDISMPGMNGCQVAAELTACPATRHVPIIAATGFDDTAKWDAALEAGCTSVIAKPIVSEHLLTQVAAVLKTGR
jgi:two-component system cell cycle response regulator DivK